MQKGVDVSEIESKKVVTENKIAELDKKLEELPNVREGLVAKYREEKEEQLKANAEKDYVKERAEENIQLFKQEKQNSTQIIDSLQEEKYEYQGRKR